MNIRIDFWHTRNILSTIENFFISFCSIHITKYTCMPFAAFVCRRISSSPISSFFFSCSPCLVSARFIYSSNMSSLYSTASVQMCINHTNEDNEIWNWHILLWLCQKLCSRYATAAMHIMEWGKTIRVY